ncbi:MAG: adenylate/guanylate cyclase domain-containing protein [Gammaproteobacteria bacterium]|nr:MAG: adenylate/guanylate cyclase domain-containing protein [Gammaproteobacteria bacterium]
MKTFDLHGAEKSRHRGILRGLLILAAFLLLLGHASGLLNLSWDWGARLAIRDELIRNYLETGHYRELLQAPEVALFLVTGVLLSLLLPSLTPIRASLLTLAAMVPPLWLALHDPRSGQVIPMEFTLLTILVLYGLHILTAYFTEVRQKQRILELFGRYVPRDLVRTLASSREGIDTAGEAREMSVLFCDIIGFTDLSEKMEPRELVRMLNHHFNTVSEVLFRHGATIDKYMGDSVMAFWGAPLRQPDHARRAVLAALEMVERVRALHADFRQRGWPELDVGIGISSGTMAVGNMGSDFRVNYTVVGDAVNLAARLEELTRNYRRPILVSESTRDLATGIAFRELDTVRVRGRDQQTRLFEPLGPAEGLGQERLERLQLHRQALEAYYGHDREQAGALFRKLADQEPELAPYCGLMLARLERPDPGQEMP